jgi:hypothetical protein
MDKSAISQKCESLGVRLDNNGCLTKGDFAKFVSRSQGCVSQWVNGNSSKEVPPKLIKSIHGTGRSSRIHVATALHELKNELDVSQQMSQEKPVSATAIPEGDLVDLAKSNEEDEAALAMKSLKVRKARADAEMAELRVQEQLGNWIKREALNAAVGNVVSQIIHGMDGLKTDLTSEIVGKLHTEQLPTRQVVKKAIDKMRDKLSEQLLGYIEKQDQ